jgi:hypothetical protein
VNIPVIPDEIAMVKDQQLRRALSSMWTNLTKAINGGLYLGSPQEQAKSLLGNVNGLWPGTLAGGYTITTPGVANTEFTVTHNLGRVPIGYDIKSIDAAAHVYDSRKALWTNKVMFLKCDQATVHLVLFVH